jgi:hypothetical protein
MTNVRIKKSPEGSGGGGRTQLTSSYAHSRSQMQPDIGEGLKRLAEGPKAQ